MTIADILCQRGTACADQRLFSYMQNGEDVSHSYTAQELHTRAMAIAVTLTEHGCKVGDRVILLYSPSIFFIDAFYGCLYAGVIAVPLKAPNRNQSLQPIERVVHDCKPGLLLTDSLTAGDICARKNDYELLKHLNLVTTDKLERDEIVQKAEFWGRPHMATDALAFLQYTSGSTGNPKGACISHLNIISNMEMINKAFHHSPDTTMVSWLPVFHDMGLVGSMMQPVYNGFLGVFMPPLAFLQKPMRWLKAISRFQATSSGGPNFAYDLCVKKFNPDLINGIDLSSWEVAYNGGEPVRANTVRKFSNLFSQYGFRPTSYHPCYGMAETTLIASGGFMDEMPKIIPVYQKFLEQGIAVTAPENFNKEPDDKVLEIARCGESILDQKIRIVDPETETLCEPNRIGEIWISGPNVAKGYWGAENDGINSSFNRRIKPADADSNESIQHESADLFLKTGDLGFLSTQNELYVCGRIKDTIIIRGRNIFPKDIECCAEQSHEAIVANGVAAFQVETENEDDNKLVLVCEIKRTHRLTISYDGCIDAICLYVANNLDVAVHDVVLIDELNLPRTSSGKLRRAFCKQKYLNGEFVTTNSYNSKQ